jgi:ribosomal protein S18 acetylase RimI-like enzyme
VITVRKVGMCIELTISGGKALYHSKPGGVTEIVDVIVDEPMRRRGLGTQLIKTVKSRIDKDSVIHVFTRRTNGIARLFYKSLGMYEIVIPGFYPNDDACLFIDKERP